MVAESVIEAMAVKVMLNYLLREGDVQCQIRTTTSKTGGKYQDVALVE
jgi:hypothetical protein